MTNDKEKDIINGRMDNSIKENGAKIGCMGSEK